MPNITVITPPDKIFNTNKSILLIYPTNSLKSDFQTLIQDWDVDFNLYLYSVESTEQDHDWLLSVVKMVDIVIFDVDNATAEVRDLASYIIAHPYTYWLTNNPISVYNKLSVNRIYDLSFLKQGDITNDI